LPALMKLLVVACFLSVMATISAAPIPIQSFNKEADGVVFTMSPGKLKLTVCSDGIVRVMYSPGTNLPSGQDFVVTNRSWPKKSFKVSETNGKITLSTEKLKVAVDKGSGALAFFDAANHLLASEPADGGKAMPAVTVNGEATFQPEQTFISPDD